MKTSLLSNTFGVFLTAVVISLSVNAQEVPKTPIKSHFEPSDYGGGIQNWAFDQNQRDELLVANNDGLLIFDGARWESMGVPRSTKLKSVFSDKSGRIYVGGQGEIGYFENSANGRVFTSLLDNLPETDRQITESDKIVKEGDIIYFSTLDRLLQLDRNVLSVVELSERFLSIHKINSKAYVQTVGKGLTALENPNDHIKGSDEIKDRIISIIHTHHRLFFFTNSNGVFSSVNDEINALPSPLDQKIINSVIKLKNGMIAVGTQNSGLILLDSNLNLIHHLTKNKGLTSRTVISLHEDHLQNLWVGLHNGIDYLEMSSPMSLINEQVGLEGTGYTALRHNGELYLGTNNGLFREKNGTFEIINGSEGQVYNLSVIDSDLLMNHHNGAFLINEDRIRKISSKGSWRFIKTNTQGLILEGNYHGLTFYRKTDNEWKPIHEIDNLTESSRVILFENDSVIWMTHGYKGAYRIEMTHDLTETKAVNKYGANNGFPSNTLINIYRIRDQFIFTSEKGLFEFNKVTEQFTSNRYLNSILGETHISRLTEAENGDIYFIQGRKIGRLVEESIGEFSLISDVFKRVNQYLSDDLENITVIDENNILIGAREGFVHFDPRKPYDLPKSFDPIIKYVHLNDQDTSKTYFANNFINQSISHQNSITIQYAAPYFDGFESTTYSYRLLPVSREWSDWSTSASKEFTRLPRGSYKFEIKARNTYGIESSVSSISFEVKPPWYTSRLAILSYVLVGVLTFSLIPVIQRRRHENEKAKIQKSGEAAIREKDLKISQIAEESKVEIERLRNEKLKNEIQHKNSQLSSVTTNLLQKNELIRDIKKRIEASRISESKDKELKNVIKSIDKNLSEDDSWDQFSFHFDQVHGDFLKKVSAGDTKLSPQETKLAAYLRLNMSSKEIAGLMNISVRGVELARYRLRKKLDLTRDQNLVEYLMQI